MALTVQPKYQPPNTTFIGIKTPPKPTGTLKVVQPSTPTKNLTVKPASPNPTQSPVYTTPKHNPQQSTSPAANPQNAAQQPAQPAKPPKPPAPVVKTHMFSNSILQKDGTIKKVIAQGAFTDEEWKQEKKIIAAKNKQVTEIKKVQDEWNLSITETKNKLYINGQNELASQRVQFEIGTADREIYISALADQINASTNYDEAMDLFAQGEKYIADWEQWGEDSASLYLGTQRAYNEAMDDNNLTDTRGFFEERIASGILGKVWEFSLGSGNKNVPSLITASNRLINTTMNLANRDRKRKTISDPYGENTPTRRETEGGVNYNPFTALKNSWQLSHKQEVVDPWVSYDFDDDVLPDAQNKFLNAGGSISSSILRIMSDPASYVGASQASKLGKGLKLSGKSKAITDAKGILGRAGKGISSDFKNAIAKGTFNAGDFKPIVTSGKNIKKGFKWLGEPAKTRGQKVRELQKGVQDNLARYYDEIGEANVKIADDFAEIQLKVKAQFNKFDDEVIRGWQLDTLSKGKVDLSTFTPAQQKLIKQFSDEWKILTDDMRQLELKGGFVVPYRGGYIPKGNHPKLGGGKNASNEIFNPFPTKRRTRKANQGPVSRSELQDVVAKRFQAHKAMTHSGGFGDKTVARMKIKQAKGQLKSIEAKVPPPKFGVAGKIPGKTMDVWRASVLLGRPAWYVNNELYNRVAAITGGGIKSQMNRKGATKYLKTLTRAEQDDLVGGFRGFISTSNESMVAKFGKIASWQEEQARIGLYRSYIDKGFSHAKAIKGVNRWLFDYTPKNWERPIRAIAPFWLWQKNVTKRVATLPIETPRGAKVWSETYKAAYETPLSNLPNEELKGKDPVSGLKWSYNPRKAREGKIYNPLDLPLFKKGWYNTPFNAFTPKGVASIGINPLINLYDEVASNRDRWGNRLDNLDWKEHILRQFPQHQLWKSLREAGNTIVGGDMKIITDYWMAQGSGYTKSAQGHDASKKNYKADLDPRTHSGKALQAFLGIPSGEDFDPKKFADDLRYNKFNTEYFATDWDDESKWQKTIERWDPKTKTRKNVSVFDYEAQQADKEALAKKHGFELQKDIYDGRWSKYDTKFTQGVKAKKQDAREQRLTFSNEYTNLTNANLDKDGNRINIYDDSTTRYTQQKRIDWKKNKNFIKNPYLAPILKEWMFRGPDSNARGLDLTDPEKYFEYKEYIDSGQALEDAKSEGLAKYRATPKGQFWTEYTRLKDISKDKAFEYYQKNYKTEYSAGGKGKVAYRDTEKGKFWEEYHRLKQVDESKSAEYYEENFKDEFHATDYVEQNPEKRKFWKEFWNIKESKRWDFYKDNYKDEYAPKGSTKKKLSQDEIVELEFWKNYFESNPDIRRRLLRENPKYNKFTYQPKTSAEWTAARNENRQKKYDAVAGNKGIQARRKRFESDINKEASLFKTRGKSSRRIIWKG